MGNYRFRLSDMMPNAWFYKLKDMSRATRSNGGSHTMKRSHPSGTATVPKPCLPSHPPPPPTSKQPFIPNRASYYFPRGAETEKLPISPKASDTHYPIDSPRKSKRKSRRNPTTKPSPKLVSSGCSCRVWKPESMAEFTSNDFNTIKDDDFQKPIASNFDGDIIINIDGRSSETEELKLPPILTKREANKLDERTEAPKKQSKSPARRSPAGLHRLRTRANTPRIVSRKSTGSRKGLSGSFAVVKRSSDPQRDFRDSMMEMIVENNIRASRDLEELLACYLTLNSNEYHDVIVKVFEQIWFDLTDIIKCK